MNGDERRAGRRADHGTFTIPAPPFEGEIFASLAAGAPSNRDQPGHRWARVEGTRDRDGATITGYRKYHLDLPGRVVEITEEWDGIETARRTVPVDERGHPVARARRPPRPQRARKAAGAPLRPVRRSLDGLNPRDADAVRQQVLIAAEVEILPSGALGTRLLLVCDDHVEDLPVDTGSSPLATFAALAERSDVTWRVLQGQVEHDGRARTAFVLAVAHDDPAGEWWLATTTFDVLPGRLGSSTSPWEVTVGDAYDGPPELVRARFGDGGRPWPLLPAQPLPMPELLTGFDELPAGAPVPRDPISATMAAAALLEQRAVTEGLDGTVVIVVFREREIEHWHVQGEIPCGLDDLVRAIAVRGTPPSAVATMKLEPMRVDGELRRAVVTVGEAAGKRYLRALTMRYTAEVGDDRPAQVNLRVQALPDPGSDGWIGVQPISGLDLFPLDAGDA